MAMTKKSLQARRDAVSLLETAIGGSTNDGVNRLWIATNLGVFADHRDADLLITVPPGEDIPALVRVLRTFRRAYKDKGFRCVGEKAKWRMPLGDAHLLVAALPALREAVASREVAASHTTIAV